MSTSEQRFEQIEHNGLIFVVDPKLASLRKFEPEVHEVFENLLTKHIKDSNGLIELLPYDPDEHLAERLDVVEVISPTKIDEDVIRGFAISAYPGFEELEEQVRDPVNTKMYSHIAADLALGMDYIIAMEHGKILNTPLGGFAIIGAIEEQARQAEIPEYITRLTISKILSRARALGQPAVELLALLGRVDMSFPRSRTMDESGIPSGVRYEFNSSLKDKRVESQDDSDQAFIDLLSPSGGTDVRVPRQFGRNRQQSATHMGPMSKGTTDMFTRARTLTASVNVNSPRPRSLIGRVSNPVSNPVDAHSVMVDISRLASESTKQRHIYHPDKDSYDLAVKKGLSD